MTMILTIITIITIIIIIIITMNTFLYCHYIQLHVTTIVNAAMLAV